MLRVGEPEQLKAVFKALTDHPEELKIGEALNRVNQVKHLMRILEDIFDILHDVDESKLRYMTGLWDTLYIFNKRCPSPIGNYLNDRMVEWSGSTTIVGKHHSEVPPIVASYLEEPDHLRQSHRWRMSQLPGSISLGFLRFRDMLRQATPPLPISFRWSRPRQKNKKEILPKWRQVLSKLDRQVFGNGANRWLEIGRKIITMMKRGCNTKLEWDAYLLFALLVDEKFLYHPGYSDHVWRDIYYHWDSPFDAHEYVDAFMNRERQHLRRWAKTDDASILDDIEERIVKTPYMTCLYGHLFQKRAEALWHPGVLRSGEWVKQGGLVRKRLEEIKEFNAKAEELTKAHKRDESI